LPPGRKPILCYVTDRRAIGGSGDSPEFAPGASAAPEAIVLHDVIRRAVTSGASWIQIREKDLPSCSLLDLTRFAVAETRAASVRVFVNDRLDVALAANAAGVHLGENSVAVEAVSAWRRAAGRADFLIGASCHSLESARGAERGGADYVFFGPVFATPSKAAFGPPHGIERLREVCGAIAIPVLAIGGINLENARECVEAGAAGIAAIRLFQDVVDTEELSARLRTL
jgi:thiamine-phosphate pyrophosphorylase